MKTRSALALSLCAIGLALPAVPSAAEEMTVEGRTVYQERVNFSDLDLRQGSHQQALRLRVRHASDRVCVALEGPDGAYAYGLAAGRNAGMNCVDLTYAAARPQITNAIQHARSGQVMAISTTIRVWAR